MNTNTDDNMHMSMQLILASGSARRKEILEAHGHSPVVKPMDVDETLPAGIDPKDAVMYLALKKALACEAMLDADPNAESNATPDPSPSSKNANSGTSLSSIPVNIISADTIVFANDITRRTNTHPEGTPTIFGKPKDEDDAWRMLSSIRGTSHQVITGVCVIKRPARGSDSDHDSKPGASGDHNGLKTVFYDVTNVFVNDISDADLKAYIDSGEPFGKAGGYAIQMVFGKYIDHIEGDYENVVGLPYYRIEPLL